VTVGDNEKMEFISHTKLVFFLYFPVEISEIKQHKVDNKLRKAAILLLQNLKGCKLGFFNIMV